MTTTTFQERLSPGLVDLLETYLTTQILTREPNQTISRHGDPYIKRYMLARKAMVPIIDNPSMPIGWAGGIPSEIENIYIHEFIR